MKTRLIGHVAAIVLGLAIAGAGCGDNLTREQPPTPDPTRVQLVGGEIQGGIVGTSRQFLGIPYAKPPVGDLRWKAPQKPDPWADVRAATDFGKRCAQLENKTLQNARSTDEDCLYLNVWTPSPIPAGTLPVMVWIHGGGNVNGSTSEPVPFVNSGLFYTGEFLAEDHNVIVVSLNYRLGVLGFFAHSAAGGEAIAGNFGLLDQRMALQWVHDNILQFGGDPNRVTIFGESAGSFDVCMHVASPGSRGLFQRAISESGGCTTRQPTLVEAATTGDAFAASLGCTGADALTCMRGKTAAALIDATGSTRFAPDVDGDFMRDQPRALYDAGDIADVPYLLGSNTDEGTLFVTQKITTQAEYTAALTSNFGAQSVGAIEQLYSMDKFTDAPPNPAQAAFARVIGDARLVCSTFDTAQRMAKTGAPVFMYNFAIPVPPELTPGIFLGASHGSELSFVFDSSPLLATNAPAKAASDLIQRYWTNFARTGDPNAGDDPKWPAFDESHNLRINLALQPSIFTDFRKAECEFWQAGYTQQFLAP